jgi:hypothetical protein
MGNSLSRGGVESIDWGNDFDWFVLEGSFELVLCSLLNIVLKHSQVAVEYYHRGGRLVRKILLR